MNIQYLFVLLGAILISLGWIGWTLRRILRIMAYQNKGIPGVSDLSSVSLDQMAAHKK